MVFCASLIVASVVQLGESVAVSQASSNVEAISCLQTRGSETLQESEHEQAFAVFIQENERSYRRDSSQYTERLELFKQRAVEVQHWNSQPDRLWTATINHLSDWTPEEKKNLFGYRGHSLRTAHATLLQSSVPSSLDEQSQRNVSVFKQDIPDIFLLNASNLETVEDQGGCGSCWAFAATKMVETNHLLGTGKHRSFSPQFLVDCTPNPEQCGGNGGCEGATVELAMATVLASTAEWPALEKAPYTARTGTCGETKISGDSAFSDMNDLAQPGFIRMAQSAPALAISMQSWERLPENKGQPLKVAIYLWGSVAVSVDGTPWFSYSNGIFDGCNQDAIINHAVLCTGYGKNDDGVGFFKILNSWGSYWGENGSIRLLDVADDFCGTDSKPEDGTACKDGPASVEVCGMCGLYYDNVVAKFGGQ